VNKSWSGVCDFNGIVDDVCIFIGTRKATFARQQQGVTSKGQTPDRWSLSYLYLNKFCFFLDCQYFVRSIYILYIRRIT
jgi:hypothetical protein